MVVNSDRFGISPNGIKAEKWYYYVGYDETFHGPFLNRKLAIENFGSEYDTTDEYLLFDTFFFEATNVYVYRKPTEDIWVRQEV